jgi:hypothetical protein
MWPANAGGCKTHTRFWCLFTPRFARREQISRKLTRTQVSLVVKPFFDQARISVCATSSDGNLYKTETPQKNVQHVFVPMDSSTPATNNDTSVAAPAAQQPKSVPAVPAPQAQGQQNAARDISQNAAEIELKHLREQQAKEKAEMEAERKRVKDMADALAKYQAKEKAEKDALVEAKVKELEATMQNVRKGLGMNELPKEFVEDHRKFVEGQVLLDDDNPVKKYVDVQASMMGKFGAAFASKEEEAAKMRAELAAKDAELAQLRELHAKTQQEVGLAAQRVAASRDAIYKEREPTPVAASSSATTTTTVAASGSLGYLHGSQMSDILEVPHVQPNTWAGDMYARDYNPHFGASRSYGVYGITASGVAASSVSEVPKTVKLQAPPAHDRLHQVPNSLRFRVDEDGNPTGAAAFSHIVRNFSETAVTSPAFKVTKQEYNNEKTY